MPGTWHTSVVQRLLPWFEANGRDLPWRDPSTTPWGVLVSEIMLQQTPASRVEPRWREWMECWPTPAALAAASTADVLHAWGRLGYPRRALRLHEAAQHIESVHGGIVPSSTSELRAIPGIGEYTAAAIQSFAFHQPSVVLDVNIRRVLTRVFLGTDISRTSISAIERQLGARALEEAGHDPRWNATIMEFGALVCTARNPLCGECPIADRCAWRAAGYPALEQPRRGQAWAGTDRQVRGIVMAHLRSAPEFTADRADLLALWDRSLRSARLSRLSLLTVSSTNRNLAHTAWVPPKAIKRRADTSLLRGRLLPR